MLLVSLPFCALLFARQASVSVPVVLTTAGCHCNSTQAWPPHSIVQRPHGAESHPVAEAPLGTWCYDEGKGPAALSTKPQWFYPAACAPNANDGGGMP